MIDRTVLTVAMARQTQRLAARDVITSKILDRSIAADLQFRWSSLYRHIQQRLSPPALVVTGEEFCELPELRPVPLNREPQWRITQRVRTLPRSAHLQQAHIV